MVAKVRNNRITTDPGQFFVQCVPLPLREESLSMHEMAIVEGGNGKEIPSKYLVSSYVIYTPPPGDTFVDEFYKRQKMYEVYSGYRS